MADPKSRRLTAVCRCGQTAIDLDGAPIVSAICSCRSCQAAGRQFELASGGPPVLRADGGTEYCLFRKDRVNIVSGEQGLEERRLKPASPTRRIVASCCGAPMFLDFTKGFWLTVYRDRISGAPPLEMRIMAKDAPAGVRFADDIPTYPTQPPKLLLRLLAAWAAMGFRRPKISPA